MLTKREKEIFNLIKKGKTNRQISCALGISPNTVKSILYKAYKKHNIKNRTEIAAGLY